MNQAKKIFSINSSNYIFESTITLMELLNYLGFNENVIVIDYNGLILEKKLWKKTYLRGKTRIYSNFSLEI